jgi:hypothetical protein
VRPDDHRAEQLASRIGDDLGKPIGLALGTRAVDLGEGNL